MRFISNVLIAGLMVMTDVATAAIGHAQDVCKFSIDFNDFVKLNNEQKRQLVHSACQYRITHAQNLYYDSSMVVRNHQYSDGAVHDIVWTGLKFGYEHWQLGDSGLVEKRLYGDPSNQTPQTVVRTGFNSKAVDSAAVKVSPWHHPNLTNRYSYWLNGEDNGIMAVHHFVRLVKSREEFVFELPEKPGLIKLSIPWHPRGFREANGSWQYFLDPTKGFLAVSGNGSWKDESQETENWRVEEFTASDFTLVSGVWMPKTLREIVRASTLEEGVANVYETTILKIEHGDVEPGDLEGVSE